MNDDDQKYYDYLLEREAPTIPVAGTVRPGAINQEIGAYMQSPVERAVEDIGVGLEEVGKWIDKKAPGSLNDLVELLNLGQEIPIVGEMRLRDLVPFVGSTMKTEDISGKEVEREFGTPQALQMYGRGERLTTGSGVARQMKPDVKAAAAELVMPGVLQGAGVASKVARKTSRKALAKSLREAGPEGRKPVGNTQE